MMKKKDEIKTDDEEERQNLEMKLVYSKNELIKKAKKEIVLIKQKIKDKKKDQKS